jgi:hypothetical protein
MEIVRVYQLVLIYKINGKNHFSHDSIFASYNDAEIEAKKRCHDDTMDYQIHESILRGKP